MLRTALDKRRGSRDQDDEQRKPGDQHRVEIPGEAERRRHEAAAKWARARRPAPRSVHHAGRSASRVANRRERIARCAADGASRRDPLADNYPQHAAPTLLRIGSFRVYRGRAVFDINEASPENSRARGLPGRSRSPSSARSNFQACGSSRNNDNPAMNKRRFLLSVDGLLSTRHYRAGRCQWRPGGCD